ncbi:MAG TPA: hypothetical protein VKZ57_05595 [Sphingobacterium sp.]|jgi:hypothetical protein|nr:hypothetical protein [Sphingobacterium sp.]
MLNIKKEYRQYLAVFASVVFVLLSSCPVKSSIKSLAGFPVNTEQQTKKNNSTAGNGMEKCAHVQTTDAKISQSTSTNMSDLLPVVFIVVAFMLLFGYRHIYVQAHPRYSSLKIPGTLPIFLQFRKLII